MLHVKKEDWGLVCNIALGAAADMQSIRRLQCGGIFRSDSCRLPYKAYLWREGSII